MSQCCTSPYEAPQDFDGGESEDTCTQNVPESAPVNLYFTNKLRLEWQRAQVSKTLQRHKVH